MLRDARSFMQDAANGQPPLEVLHNMGRDGAETGLLFFAIGLISTSLAMLGWNSFDSEHLLLLGTFIFGMLLGPMFFFQGLSQMRRAKRLGYR